MPLKHDYPIAPLAIGDFLVYIDKMIDNTLPGKYFSISFNGENTITCSVSEKTTRMIEGIDKNYASEVEKHIKSKNIEVKKFRISPSAFEATFKRTKISGR